MLPLSSFVTEDIDIKNRIFVANEFISRWFPPEIPGFVTSVCAALDVASRAGVWK